MSLKNIFSYVAADLKRCILSVIAALDVIFTVPPILCHEFSHLVFAILLGVGIRHFSLSYDVSGEGINGTFVPDRTIIEKRFLIAIAPIFVNLLIALMLWGNVNFNSLLGIIYLVYVGAFLRFALPSPIDIEYIKGDSKLIKMCED